MQRIFSSLFILLLLTSCDDSEPYSVDAPDKLVIEGHIDSNGYPTVILTSTANGTKPGSIKDHIMNWSKVTISDGDTTIIMTGRPDSDLFPPYYYTTYEMEGKVGKTYTIQAECGALKASSTCKLPQSCIEVLGWASTPVEGSDTLRSIDVRCRAIAPGYVKVFCRVKGSDYQPLPSPFCTYHFAEAETEETLQVRRGKSAVRDEENYLPNFIVGDTVEVRISTISKAVYDFWLSYDNSTNFGSQLVAKPVSQATNIENGYGVWSAQSTLVYHLLVK